MTPEDLHAPSEWCVEVEDIKIIACRQGIDWWIDFRRLYEPTGRVQHIEGTATPMGDRCRVLCHDREHAEDLAAHMIDFGGVPRTAVKARRISPAGGS